jgi:hypothetical protein
MDQHINEINLKYLYENKQNNGHIIVYLIKVECDEMYIFIGKKVNNDGYGIELSQLAIHLEDRLDDYLNI